MQTFLPYADFRASAECLDNKRLGKQRVEVLQIYKALTVKEYGWKHHPIVKMWKDYEGALLCYGMIMCNEWRSRGFKDSLLEPFQFELAKQLHVILPYWLGNKQLHSSHRSNLLRKDPLFYGKYNWREGANLPYVWIKR